MQPGLRRLAPGSRAADRVGPRRAAPAREARGAAGACRQCAAAAPRLRRPARAVRTGRAGRGGTSHGLRLGRRNRHVPPCWAGRCATATSTEVAGAAAGLGARSARACDSLPPSWRLAGLHVPGLRRGLRHHRWPVGPHSLAGGGLAVALGAGDKVGRHFVQVHAPVADNRHLLAAGEALARLVTADTRWERFVWSIGTSAQLNLHPRCPGSPGAAATVGTQACWRTERQTFIPVPECRAGGVHDPRRHAAAGATRWTAPTRRGACTTRWLR